MSDKQLQIRLRAIQQIEESLGDHLRHHPAVQRYLEKIRQSAGVQDPNPEEARQAISDFNKYIFVAGTLSQHDPGARAMARGHRLLLRATPGLTAAEPMRRVDLMSKIYEQQVRPHMKDHQLDVKCRELYDLLRRKVETGALTQDHLTDIVDEILDCYTHASDANAWFVDNMAILKRKLDVSANILWDMVDVDQQYEEEVGDVRD